MEVKSLPKVEVSLHVDLEISEDKKVTLGNIATSIKGLGIEAKITEQIIQAIDEQKVAQICGTKYQRGNGDNTYQRGGTFDRYPVTAIGKLNLKLHKVVDTAANKILKPIYDVIDFAGKRIY